MRGLIIECTIRTIGMIEQISHSYQDNFKGIGNGGLQFHLVQIASSDDCLTVFKLMQPVNSSVDYRGVYLHT